MHYLDVLDREAFGKVIDPRRLQSHGRVERLFAFISQDDKLRPSVMPVGLEGDEPLLVEVVRRSLRLSRINSARSKGYRSALRSLMASLEVG